MQLPPQTEALLEAERLLFLLCDPSLEDGSVVDIDGGPRLAVFETHVAMTRASDLAHFGGGNGLDL